MQFLVPGAWWLRSASDPRWNAKGESPAVGGFVMPEEVEAKLKALTVQLGPPPADLEWGYHKY
jgi:hypothetical protein